MTDCIVTAVDPDKVILFGSHARGDARDGSDVDLAIVLKDEAPSRKDAHLNASMAIREFLFPVDLLVYRRTEFERFVQGAHGLAHDLAEGHTLYERQGTR